MIVVDASVVVELLLRTEAAPTVDRRLFRRGETLHAPQLLDVEVTQVLRRYALRGELPGVEGAERVELLRLMPIVRYPHVPLLDRIWELRENASAYDAAYLALAEALGAPLVTRDAKLAGVRSVRATVEIV